MRLNKSSAHLLRIVSMFMCLYALGAFTKVIASEAEPSAGGSALGHDAAGEIVAAVVNGKEINMEMLLRKMMELAQTRYGKKEITDLVAQKLRSDALDELITEELAYQKAFAGVGKPKEAQVDQAVAELKENHGGEEAFQEFLKASGMSFEKYRSEVARTLTVKNYIKEKIESAITVSDDEISAAYQGAKDQYFVQKEQVQVTLFTFFLDADSPEAIQKAAAVRNDILENFQGDATKRPMDGTYVLQETTTLDPVKQANLYEAAKAAGENGITPPIVVDGTIYMAQLTGYKPNISKSLEEVREYLSGEIFKRKRQSLIQQWAAGLKDGAQIEIRDVTL